MNIIIKAFATGGNKGAGSQNRAGSGNKTLSSTAAQRRGNESMGNYARRVGYLFGTKIGQKQRGKQAGKGRIK